MKTWRRRPIFVALFLVCAYSSWEKGRLENRSLLSKQSAGDLRVLKFVSRMRLIFLRKGKVESLPFYQNIKRAL